MAGNRQSGLKTRDINIKNHGADYYKLLGARGGQAKVSKGFGKNKTLASVAGRRGGTISRKNAPAKILNRDIGDSVIYYADNVHGEATSGEGVIRQVLDLSQGTAYHVLDNKTGETVFTTLVA